MTVLPLCFASTYPTIDGTWKNFVTNYSAPTDGTTNASTALDAWLADGTATKLYIPPGTYNLGGTNTLSAGKAVASVYAVGVTVNDAWIGPVNAAEFGQTTTARVSSIAAGQSTVTLKNSALIGRFTAGKKAMMCGLCTQVEHGTNINGSGWQGTGDPPNWHFFEFVTILSVTSSTVTFTAPLRNSYLDTWPEFNGAATTLDYGGPAMLCALPDEWDSDVKIYGLRNTKSNFATIRGRKVLLQGCSWTGNGPSWSVVQDGLLIGPGDFVGGEVDKLNETIHYHYATGSGNLLLQSSSNENLFISMCNVFSWNGTAKNTTISRSVFNDLRCGPASYGAGTSIAIQDSTVATTRIVARAALPISSTSFSGGTISILKSNNDAVHMIECAVPGEKWGMCYNDTTRYSSENLGSVSFSITAVREDATHFFADTSLVSMPAPTFDGGNPATHFFNWPADTITQTNTGPANLAALVAP